MSPPSLQRIVNRRRVLHPEAVVIGAGAVLALVGFAIRATTDLGAALPLMVVAVVLGVGALFVGRLLGVSSK